MRRVELVKMRGRNRCGGRWIINNVVGQPKAVDDNGIQGYGSMQLGKIWFGCCASLMNKETCQSRGARPFACILVCLALFPLTPDFQAFLSSAKLPPLVPASLTFTELHSTTRVKTAKKGL